MSLEREMWDSCLKINRDEKDGMRAEIAQLKNENGALKTALEALVKADEAFNLHCPTYPSQVCAGAVVSRREAIAHARVVLEESE